jgi:class 3 adenylate cyclase
MAETRKLAAILAADVVGYSRLAGADEERTLARLRALRSDLIDPTIALYHGRIVKRTGDGTIVEFRSVVDAVRLAIEVQGAMVDRNAATWSRRATAISWASGSRRFKCAARQSLGATSKPTPGSSITPRALASASRAARASKTSISPVMSR